MMTEHRHEAYTSGYRPEVMATVQTCSCGAKRNIHDGITGSWEPLEGYYSEGWGA